jgi:hypothetical protein
MASYPDLQLHIGGQWKTASGSPVLNPADETTIGTTDAIEVGSLSINNFVASVAETWRQG